MFQKGLSTVGITAYCPVCMKNFSSAKAELPIAEAFRQSTDFFQRRSQPYLRYEIHTCPTCFFSGDYAYLYEYAPDENGTAKKIDAFTKECLCQELEETSREVNGSKPVPGPLKFWLAAICMKYLDPHRLRPRADLLLKAAWSCIEENRAEPDEQYLVCPADERFFRLRAADLYIRALGSGDVDAAIGVESPEIHTKDRARYQFIVAEQYRRTGDVAEARWYYNCCLEELKAHGGEQQLRIYARQQMAKPRDWLP